MRNKLFTGLLAAATCLAMGTLPGQAFTYSSKLSTGKWVKIAIPEDGIYQITAQQLAEMGFNDINQVQIYGQGGHPINEQLLTTISDDLTSIPVAVLNGKLVFYGQGTVGKVMRGTASQPYYERTRNAYANQGYYFVTEGGSPTPVATQHATTPGTNLLTDSYAMFLHEAELMSAGHTGKKLLGESIFPDATSITFELPNRSSDEVLMHVEGAAHAMNKTTYIETSTTVASGTIEHDVPTRLKKVYYVTKENEAQTHFFETAFTWPIDVSQMGDNSSATLNVWLDNPGNADVSLGRLDYFTMAYKRSNVYTENNSAYFAMDFPQLDANDQVVMTGVDSTTIVWDITNPQQVTQMQLAPVTVEQDGTSGIGFTPGSSSDAKQFIAFNPQQELRQIAGFSPVEPQNLHGMTTPHMLIVTNQYLMPEAERLAQLHRDHDGIDVAVVDQEQVFNEFSSGTPDAMAIRLLCKMLYDRNRYKLQHLLMFGPASFDFRGITTHKDNIVITYVSDASQSDAYSFSSDDFFGVLTDNTGTSLSTEQLSIGVGRLTPSDLTQARNNVDKIAHYVLNPDFGPWRNHYTIWADQGTTNDINLHDLQAEGIDNLIQDKLGIPMVADKTYVAMFPKTSSNIAAEARRHIADVLNYGQFYADYVGHAGTKVFTKFRLWSNVDVQNQSYSRLPIFMTACCDVARFDGNDQGIAETMLHKRDGGAIALLASSREVSAANNDNLNHAFTSALFNYNSTGQMTTLGEAYKAAKNSSIVYGDYNKLSFLLLGDPAIKVLYPKPLVNITQVNGVDVTQKANSASLAPLQQVTVEADVLSAGTKTVNTAFNGEATLTIYDNKPLFSSATYSYGNIELEGDIYYSRDILTEVQGRVENGHFTGTAVMPRHFKAQAGQQLAITLYAHQTGTTEMVNGITTQVTAAAYNEATAVQDDTAPVIQAMYLNEQHAFEQGMPVSDEATLHVTAIDDVAFNNQTTGIGTATKLTLDGGKTNYTQVRNYQTIGNQGKTLELHFPISKLTAGKHSLTINVQDIAGNMAERTIYFMVAGSSQATIKTDNLVATSRTTVDLEQSNLADMPPMTLKVVDAQGHLVWSTTSTLPCEWPLTDNAGQRVAPGLYKLFGQYDDGVNHGGTNITPIIVIDPVHTSNN